jgi:hypothetical protein
MFAMRAFDFLAAIFFVALKKPTTMRAGNFNFGHVGEAGVQL